MVALLTLFAVSPFLITNGPFSVYTVINSNLADVLLYFHCYYATAGTCLLHFRAVRASFGWLENMHSRPTTATGPFLQ